MNLVIATVAIAAACACIQSLFFRLFIRRTELPRRTLRKAFLWGMSGAVLLSYVVQSAYQSFSPGADRDHSLMVVVGPLAEELFKACAPIALYLSAQVRGKRALLTAGAVSGIGFAFLENILYAAITTDARSWAFQIVVRFMFLGFNHAFFSGLFGLCIGIASNFRSWFLKPFLVLIGYLLAASLHGIHNATGLTLLTPNTAREGLGLAILFSFGIGCLYLLLLLVSRYRMRAMGR